MNKPSLIGTQTCTSLAIFRTIHNGILRHNTWFPDIRSHSPNLGNNSDKAADKPHPLYPHIPGPLPRFCQSRPRKVDRHISDNSSNLDWNGTWDIVPYYLWPYKSTSHERNAAQNDRNRNCSHLHIAHKRVCKTWNFLVTIPERAKRTNANSTSFLLVLMVTPCPHSIHNCGDNPHLRRTNEEYKHRRNIW